MLQQRQQHQLPRQRQHHLSRQQLMRLGWRLIFNTLLTFLTFLPLVMTSDKPVWPTYDVTDDVMDNVDDDYNSSAQRLVLIPATTGQQLQQLGQHVQQEQQQQKRVQQQQVGLQPQQPQRRQSSSTTTTRPTRTYSRGSIIVVAGRQTLTTLDATDLRIIARYNRSVGLTSDDDVVTRNISERDVRVLAALPDWWGVGGERLGEDGDRVGVMLCDRKCSVVSLMSDPGRGSSEEGEEDKLRDMKGLGDALGLGETPEYGFFGHPRPPSHSATPHLNPPERSSMFYLAKTTTSADNKELSALLSVEMTGGDGEVAGEKAGRGGGGDAGNWGAINSLKFDQNCRFSYKVGYVYGFEDRGFTYFLTVQRETVDLDGHYETRLARFCQDDHSFHSYTEIKLNCQKRNRVRTSSSDYNIALAGRLAHVGPELAQKFHLSPAEPEPVLFVAAGRSDPGPKVDGTFGEPQSQQPQREWWARAEYGTGLCAYSMAEIRKDFLKVQKDCYLGEGSLLEWIHRNHTETRCQKHRQMASLINDSFCGSKTNVGISGKYVLDCPSCVEAVYTTDQYQASSLEVIIVNNKTVALIGTETGQLLKVVVDGFSKTSAHADLDLVDGLRRGEDGGERSAGEGVGEDGGSRMKGGKLAARDLQLDPTQQFAYVLTGPRVSKVPVRSCSIYTSCSACVLTTDPLNCGWCEDHCSQLTNCSMARQWQPDSCPPIINHFEPKSGPVEGGTVLTIYGHNFGNGSKTSTAMVRIEKSECRIQHRNSTTIECVTSPTVEGLSHVIVAVTDTSMTTAEYKIEGRVVSVIRSFSYRVASMESFEPVLGPRSGGSPLTIYGHNLDIGSRPSVTLAGHECHIHSITSSSVVCNSSAAHEGGSMRGVVKLMIDSANLTSPASSLSHQYYTYVEDPTISDINPRLSILSGGMRLTVTGENLHAFPRPIIKAVFNLNGNILDTRIESCYPSANGTSMLCLSPNMTGPSPHLSRDTSLKPLNFPETSLNPILLPTTDDIFHVHVQFQMDDAHWLDLSTINNTYTSSTALSGLGYTSDPIILPFDDQPFYVTHITDLLLTINGDLLNLAARAEDYTVTVDNQSCVVYHLERTRLICRLTNTTDDERTSANKLRPVIVSVGRLNVYIGDLVLIPPPLVLQSLVVVLLLGSILLVGSFGACLFWRMKQAGCGPFKRRGRRTVPNILYTTHGYNGQNGATRLVIMGEGVERRTNSMQRHMNPALNPYWSDGGVGGTDLLDDESQRLLSDSLLLIPRNKLLLCDVIGQGHFGCVYRAILKHGAKEETEVAVKTLKSLAECIYTSPSESKKFLEEALTMREFNHVHVLSLIGIVLDRRSRQPLVVLPFMKHGDLLSYVRDDCNCPTVKDLMDFAIQIAEGMSYLSNLKFVHRDLAARNCMLDDELNVKVADFGLSRDIYERDYYSSDDRKAKLPVKWMALESLEKGIYNIKTDVWSFGVVVWELMTRGVCPYPEVDNWDIVKYLKTGRRMLQPSFCPDTLFQLVLLCWHPDAHMRPTFDNLSQSIDNIISTMKGRQLSVVGLDVTYVNVETTASTALPSPSDYLRPRHCAVVKPDRDMKLNHCNGIDQDPEMKEAVVEGDADMKLKQYAGLKRDQDMKLNEDGGSVFDCKDCRLANTDVGVNSVSAREADILDFQTTQIFESHVF